MRQLLIGANYFPHVQQQSVSMPDDDDRKRVIEQNRVKNAKVKEGNEKGRPGYDLNCECSHGQV